jgi:energy-coupling factor transporter ATP-binding protein EcfA2
MKYADLISFNPIESIIQLTAANDKKEAINLVKSYVMSDGMADKLTNNMLSQLRLEDVVDNKGVLLVGNYGTGKSHLMSVISSIAYDAENLDYVQNKKFAEAARIIAGKFEVLRIEIGASKMSLRNIILTKVKQDFAERGLIFDFPDEKDIISNKDVLLTMMDLFSSKYPDKGYLIVVDEFLDYLGGRKSQEIKLDLGFMRELGEIIKTSRLRAIFGVQEKLFDNPSFSFVSNTLNRVKDRFEQVTIRKEDTAYVVSERILKKTPEQKALIREHLQKFCSLYTNMSERMEEYVDLFPIHPSYIEVFNKIYIIENRHILKNISEIIRRILDDEITDESPGIVSFDSYWSFIKENLALKTDANIKEVVEKSGMLEDIVNRSFPKRLYKPLALQIIYALSVHRLTTGDISIRAGLTAENLRDDLCLYLKGMPDQSSDTLQSLIQTVLKDIMTTVSGQFIEHNADNGQYYLDLKKDIDYDEKITQRAAIMDDDSLNSYFYDVVYYCLEWDQKEYVDNFKIYEHRLNWVSHAIFRSGYLFFGTPESRPTAQPPEDYYIYFIPPYGNSSVGYQ